MAGTQARTAPRQGHDTTYYVVQQCYSVLYSYSSRVVSEPGLSAPSLVCWQSRRCPSRRFLQASVTRRSNHVRTTSKLSFLYHLLPVFFLACHTTPSHFAHPNPDSGRRWEGWTSHPGGARIGDVSTQLGVHWALIIDH